MSNNTLNTNMRSLKRIPGPNDRLVYTLESKLEQGKKKLLCNHCGARDAAAGFGPCESYHRLAALEGQGINMLVKTCPTFEPLLTFRPPLRGFDGEFNTFRLGSAWYYRIGKGVKAALVDTTTAQVFGKAEVISAEVGPLDEMCREHAYLNHSLLGLDQEEAAIKMRKLIRQVYGMVEIDDSTQMTVIYLRNMNAPGSESEG